MAYRKRSLDMPGPSATAAATAVAPDSAQTISKHPRSFGQFGNRHHQLPPIHTFTAGPISPQLHHQHQSHHQNQQQQQHQQQQQLPSLASIQMTSPVPSPSQSTGSPLHQLGAAAAAAIAASQSISNSNDSGRDSPAAVKISRNWTREETLSLVRAIGRHYDSLKRCKTNQERSNVWHRIHKEHSSQFPGRSKKASQDRWGKVLSDYKDVMVHNKEKGAARWTFDFFKEVAAIVDGDAHFMDMTKTASPPSTGDDLNTYSFGSPSSVAASSGPPLMHHRMSEPNLNYSASVATKRPQSQSQQQSLQQQQQQHQHALLSSHFHATSPSRRTSYPQMQGCGSSSATVRQYPPPPPSLPLPPPPPTAAAAAATVYPQPMSAVEHSNDPERTCRYVLEMLEQQVRRIDVQQESLSQLRDSTKDAIRKVEIVLRQFSRPPSTSQMN
ncbi:hypothetical protein IWW48_004203 [Coemansia sp. RSA 1200]|nr:hypothetical protein IWW48_004203 [Coemansia sp. RSA 1200]